MNTKTTWRFRIKTNEYQSVIEGDRSNLFRYAKRRGNTGILLVEPDRKKTLNWSKRKRLLAKRTLYSSSSLTWKRPRGNRQFSHLFIGWKGPRDDKAQNTHVLNSRASLGTSGNKMADKHRGLHLFATSHSRQRVTQAENELETNQNTRKGLVPSTFNACLWLAFILLGSKYSDEKCLVVWFEKGFQQRQTKLEMSAFSNRCMRLPRLKNTRHIRW